VDYHQTTKTALNLNVNSQKQTTQLHPTMGLNPLPL